MNLRFLDTLMEKTVVPSFTSVGSRVRSRLHAWQALESYDLTDRVVVLTGGTSGIGEAAARLYATLGATLVIIARNPSKAQQLLTQITLSSGNEAIHTVIGDLGNRDDVHRIAQEIAQRFPVVDVLAHNAGALFNQRRYAADGTDLSVELMVSTPFLLTALLLPQLGDDRAAHASTNSARPDEIQLGDTQPGLAQPGLARPDQAQSDRVRPGRVLTMSSGGMYTQGLNVDGLQMSDDQYQGAQQYARAKRAQVILNELWAERIDPQRVVFHALHPGWVETPGITEALPGFSRILSPLGLLRNAREGADTMVWLSADDLPTHCTGKFWHDRAVRTIDMSATTRALDTRQRREQLWQWCEAHTGWQFDT